MSPASLPRWARLTAHVVLGLDIGLLVLFFGATVLVGLSGDSSAPAIEQSPAQVRASLYGNSIANAIVLGAIPLAWAVVVKWPWPGPAQYLRLQDPWRAVPRGVMWAAVSMAVVVALQWAMAAAGLYERNVVLQSFQGAMTWPLALVMAACAAFGEEVFFRGLVMNRFGLVVQAVLFGLVHAGYGTALQVLGTFAVGLLWGFVCKRHGLVAAMVAHFAYDFTVASVQLWQ